GAPERLARRFPTVYQLLWDKLRVDELYEILFIAPIRFGAFILWKVVDVFAIDGVIVNGTARAVAFAGSVFRWVQNGDVQRYAALMAVAAAAILWTVMGMGSP